MTTAALRKYLKEESNPHRVGGQSSIFVVTATIEGNEYQVVIKDIIRGVKSETDTDLRKVGFRLQQANNDAQWLERPSRHPAFSGIS